MSQLLHHHGYWGWNNHGPSRPTRAMTSLTHKWCHSPSPATFGKFLHIFQPNWPRWLKRAQGYRKSRCLWATPAIAWVCGRGRFTWTCGDAALSKHQPERTSCFYVNTTSHQITSLHTTLFVFMQTLSSVAQKIFLLRLPGGSVTSTAPFCFLIRFHTLFTWSSLTV